VVHKDLVTPFAKQLRGPVRGIEQLAGSAVSGLGVQKDVWVWRFEEGLYAKLGMGLEFAIELVEVEQRCVIASFFYTNSINKYTTKDFNFAQLC